MTRRAFLSSRVIQAQGKSSSRWRVKNLGKWFRKMKISRNDSKSLSCLKSNTGAGEIWFLSVKYYLGVSHPSSEKISGLNLQNSLRVCQNLPLGNSFRMVWQMLQGYNFRLSNRREMVRANEANFQKNALWWAQTQFFGPCRGLTHSEECIRLAQANYMTRKAFPAWRVILGLGKFDFWG